jgi:hypothetical protein
MSAGTASARARAHKAPCTDFSIDRGSEPPMIYFGLARLFLFGLAGARAALGLEFSKLVAFRLL